VHRVSIPFASHESVLVVGPESVALTLSTGPACVALFTTRRVPSKGGGQVRGQASPQDVSAISKHNQLPAIMRMASPSNVVAFSGSAKRRPLQRLVGQRHQSATAC
jgi:hypothetical protein